MGGIKISTRAFEKLNNVEKFSEKSELNPEKLKQTYQTGSSIIKNSNALSSAHAAYGKAFVEICKNDFNKLK